MRPTKAAAEVKQNITPMSKTEGNARGGVVVVVGGSLEIKVKKTKDGRETERGRETEGNREREREIQISCPVWLLLRELRSRKSIVAATQAAK